MSARAAKRWAQRLAFVWISVWLSTVLLPCSEVEAALAAYEHAQGFDCGHPAESAPAGSHKAAACLDIDEQAPASSDRLAGPITGNTIQLAPVASAAALTPPLFATPSNPQAYRAPPPVAVYLRSSRLLI